MISGLLDLKKGFHTVTASILLKMLAYGFTGFILNDLEVSDR